MRPSTFDPADTSRLRVERAAAVIDEARRLKDEHHVPRAADDRLRVAAFGIDVQVAFCLPEGSLFVPGAVEDTNRALAFLYDHAESLTTLILSLDTHRIFQIFHPSFWQDGEGKPPAPFTVITKADVREGRWIPTRDAEAALDYVERLEDGGKYVLTVWPYHALLGGVSHALVPAMMEFSLFHAALRDAPTLFETKGEHPWTENYSVLAPEVTEVGGERVGAFNQPLFDVVMKHDRVYVFGQAKSHCVLSTLRDLQRKIAESDRSLARRIYILEDAMSPVPAPPLDPLPPELDFPAVAKRAMQELADFGMNVVRCADAW